MESGMFCDPTFLLGIFSITFHFIPNFYKILTLTRIQGWIWQMIVIKNIRILIFSIWATNRILKGILSALSEGNFQYNRMVMNMNQSPERRLVGSTPD